MNDDKEPQGNPWVKSAMIWAGVIAVLLMVVSLFITGVILHLAGIIYADTSVKTVYWRKLPILKQMFSLIGTFGSSRSRQQFMMRLAGKPRLWRRSTGTIH